jgi:hypothetical protein
MKHSSLLGPVVRYKNEVLWMRPQVPGQFLSLRFEPKETFHSLNWIASHPLDLLRGSSIGATTFSTMTFSIMTLNIASTSTMGLNATLSIILCVMLHFVLLYQVLLYWVSHFKCHFAECHSDECRGAPSTQPKNLKTFCRAIYYFV